ncbi:hypothetical protein IMZ48_30495 [Candidatus Bathyarchaeota archaeon]|nr:hypothetical protein [Candidatus Bathyarchaeota archaeon]
MEERLHFRLDGFAGDIEMWETPFDGVNGWNFSYRGDEWDVIMPEHCSRG